MKKTFLIRALALAVALAPTITSCSDDHDDLWSSIDDLDERVTALEDLVKNANSEISAIRTIVSAIQQQVTVTSVVNTPDGYEIKFSDGQTAKITNGKNGSNGSDGADAPVIGVRLEADGLYYWTLDGNLLLADGKPVCASGTKGDTGEQGPQGPQGPAGTPGTGGSSAVAPQININPTTKMWEISTDGGLTWQSTGIVAEGAAGDSFFRGVDSSNSSYVIFTLADGTELKLDRYDESAPMFAVKDCEGVRELLFGQSESYSVETRNVADFSISKPDGWSVRYADGTLRITAPSRANTFAETEGSVCINIVSESGKALIVRIEVKAIPYRLRTLTFEDADARFTPYTLDYCGKTVNTWSDLVDDKQYGGAMLYGDDGMGMEEPYHWTDENNTWLSHSMADFYGYYCYFYGGHAISNYKTTDLSLGDFMHQLDVYGNGGHNGSANFAMHFGYIDDSGYALMSSLPSLTFADGKARVIDHMWVMNGNYAMNCYLSGNGLTPQIGPDDWVQIIATGYDASGAKTGETRIYMCNGPENIVRDWTKWDLSVLGEVAKVEFNLTGSSDNGAGYSQPAYFAYDDVAVRFTE